MCRRKKVGGSIFASGVWGVGAGGRGAGRGNNTTQYRVDLDDPTAWALRAQDGVIHNLQTIYKIPQIKLISRIITK